MTRKSLLALALAGLIAGGANAQQKQQPQKILTPTEKKLGAAQAAGKHTFILFTQKLDEKTRAMATDLGKALASRTNQATWALVRVDDPTEQRVVRHCNPQSATLPCVMVVAPNKIVTGMIPGKITEELVDEAIVTPAFAKCLLTIQRDQKWAVLCVISGTADALPLGVQQFVKSPGVAQIAQVIAIRANDPREAKLIRQLGLKPTTPGRVLLLSPLEQTVVGNFDVTVSATTLVNAAGTKPTQASK